MRPRSPTTGDRPGAINALREAIRIKPDFHPPYINLGRLLEDTGQAGKRRSRNGWRWSSGSASSMAMRSRTS